MEVVLDLISAPSVCIYAISITLSIVVFYVILRCTNDPTLVISLSSIILIIIALFLYALESNGIIYGNNVWAKAFVAWIAGMALMWLFGGFKNN